LSQASASPPADHNDAEASASIRAHARMRVERFKG